MKRSHMIGWTETAVASALVLGLAAPAYAGDVGSFFGGVVGGIIGSQMQQPQPQYQQPYQPPSYYQQQQSAAAAEARREYLAHQAELKKQKLAADKAKQDQDAAAQQASANATAAAGTIEVAMKRKDGNLWVPVQINKSVTIDFVIDSGASDITIPKDVYQTLVRSGTLTNADFIGTAQYGIADGSEVKGVKFKLASIQVGNQELKGLVGSVMPSDSATPLLGLSFLSHFRSWTIDNNSGTLRLTVGDDQTQVAAAGGSTQNSAPVVQPAPVAQPAPVQQAATDGSPQQASVNPAPAPQVIVVQQGTPGTPKQVADAGPTAIFEDGTHHAMRGGGDRAMVATASPQAAPALPTGVETAAAPAAVPAATPAPAEATPAATTAVAAPGMPLFPANTPYADARHSLMALGYGPAPLPDADKCDKDTDLTCFPEREACRKADGIQCDYFWKKGDELIKVKTVAVPPTVSAVECQVNCK